MDLTVPVNMTADWGTNPILDLRSFCAKSLTSTPSTRTSPDVASYNRGMRAARELFPLPVGPTTATVCPGSALNEIPDIASDSDPGYLKDTFLNSTEPVEGTSLASPSVTEGCMFMTASMRLAETIMLGRPRNRPVIIMTETITWPAYVE